MSGHCDFCGVWHSAGCCHPKRAEYDRLIEFQREAIAAWTAGSLVKLEAAIRSASPLALPPPPDGK